MTLEVDLDTFTAAHADGALVIDVREPSEYAGGTQQWMARGLPVVRGGRENAA